MALARSERTSPLAPMASTWKRFWRRNGIPYLFILPTFLLFILFMVYPLVDGMLLSVYEWDGILPRHYVGLANFVKIFHDPRFAVAIKNTVLFTVVTTGVKIILGFLLAAALHFEVPGVRFFRAVFYLNVILPITAIGVLWSAMLNPNTGPFAAIMSAVGSELPSLLGSPTLVMWVLCFIDIWKYAGFPMIFLYAAMESIPPEMYEAADLDGAGALTKLRHITLPLIKPVLLTITMLQTIFSFKVFDIVFIMTKGGPGDASQVLTFYLYKQGFNFYKLGVASAAALVFLAISLIFSYAYIRQSGIGEAEYDY
jgi:multiple sugar transport system permease protein